MGSEIRNCPKYRVRLPFKRNRCHITFILMCVLSISSRRWTSYRGVIGISQIYFYIFSKSNCTCVPSTASKWFFSPFECLCVYLRHSRLSSKNIKSDVFWCDVDSVDDGFIVWLKGVTALEGTYNVASFQQILSGVCWCFFMHFHVGSSVRI